MQVNVVLVHLLFCWLDFGTSALSTFTFCSDTVTVYTGTDIPLCSVANLAEASRQHLEADCFWCLSKLLEGIQDNYTFAQPGIQQRISSLKELVSRIDSELFHDMLTSI